MGTKALEGKGGKDLRKEKGEALRGGGGGGERPEGGKGGKDLNRERGEAILGRKSEKIWKGLKGTGGKDLNRERAKDLKEE